MSDIRIRHEVGTRVMREIRDRKDLRLVVGWRRGVVVQVEQGRRGVGSHFEPHYFHTVKWDNTAVPDGGYFGESLTPESASTAIPAFTTRTIC